MILITGANGQLGTELRYLLDERNEEYVAVDVAEMDRKESRVDTDEDELPDLIKVSIIRPHFDGQIPAVMTASPYHQGTNDKADKASCSV